MPQQAIDPAHQAFVLPQARASATPIPSSHPGVGVWHVFKQTMKAPLWEVFEGSAVERPVCFDVHFCHLEDRRSAVYSSHTLRIRLPLVRVVGIEADEI
jgi:hypothetical protein